MGREREQVVVVSWRSLAVAFVVVVGGLLALHFTCLWLCPKSVLDPWNLSDFYPLSVFRFRRPQLYQLGIAAVFVAGYALIWPRLLRARHVAWPIVAGLGFAVVSNLLHGVRFGLDFPTATKGDGGIEYYHDAIVIQGPLWLLERYNAIQFELLEHARTHPPGPVLFYWLLYRLVHHPVLISVAVAGVSLALTLPYLRRLLRLVGGEEPPGALALYTLLPAILIYGLATVDAFIAPLFLAAVVAFVDDERRWGWLESALFVFLAHFFTFGALFLWPVLFGFELLRRRRLTRSALVLSLTAAGLAVLAVASGFDWWRAFWKAARMENQEGFLLLASPQKYLWYRLGCVAEIALFFTPFLGLLWARGWRLLKEASRDGWTLAWLAPASLAAMLLAGALKIGEAARVCLFLLPFLMLPVVATWQKLEPRSRSRVTCLVLGYGIALQLGGFYQW